MRRSVSAVATVLLALASHVLSAQQATSRRDLAIPFALQRLPACANLSRETGAFKTRATLLNVTPLAYTVLATLQPPDGSPRTATIALAPGELRSWENLLGELFGYEGGRAWSSTPGSRRPEGAATTGSSSPPRCTSTVRAGVSAPRCQRTIRST